MSGDFCVLVSLQIQMPPHGQLIKGDQDGHLSHYAPLETASQICHMYLWQILIDHTIMNSTCLVLLRTSLVFILFESSSWVPKGWILTSYCYSAWVEAEEILKLHSTVKQYISQIYDHKPIIFVHCLHHIPQVQCNSGHFKKPFILFRSKLG